MNVSEIKIGATYVGAVDYKRGLGSHRTVLEHDKEIGIVTFRIEGGKNPPDSYVALASMDAGEFAVWAIHELARQS